MKKNKKSVIKGFFVFMFLISIFAIWDNGQKILQVGSQRTNEDTFFGEIKEYSSGNASLNRGSIKEVEINWQVGGIEIREYDGEEIKFKESADNDINNENQMKYLAKNGKLILRYNGKMEEEYINKIQKKNLVLMIPKKDSLRIREIKINAVSSNIDIATDNIQKLKIDSNDGEMNICGSYKDLEIEGISGNISMELMTCPKKIKSKTVTGDITLEIPENKGFSVEHDMINGNFECDFELTSKNNYAIYKKPKSVFELMTASGSVDIEKANG
ncbi:MAG: DUF4097 family beta strand repeat-containing protein [Proteocatella sp.]